MHPPRRPASLQLHARNLHPGPHFSRPAAHRNRKASASRPGQSSSGSRIFRRGSEARPSAARPSVRPDPPQGYQDLLRDHAGARTVIQRQREDRRQFFREERRRSCSIEWNFAARQRQWERDKERKVNAPAWSKHNGHAKVAKTASKPPALKRKTALTRKDVRTDARPIAREPQTGA